jgi:Predicted S-adenosylmethionine-dependent methyltransferase involved in bacterial cell division
MYQNSVVQKVFSKTWPFLCFSLSRLSGSAHAGFLILPFSSSIHSSPGTRRLPSHVKFTSTSITLVELPPDQRRRQSRIQSHPPPSASQRQMIHDAFAEESSPSTSLEFAMDPYSPQARSITESLGISLEHHKQLCKHAELVVEWNDRLNLISRKDCNVNVVFGRHILPSLALAALPDFPLATNDDEMVQIPKARIVDVGTGGGFPGVPLAIIYPESEFLLVDSVGKKLKAIEEMAKELGLNNIQTHHGRAEEIVDDPLQGRKYKNSFDICVGRSVTAMPRFCFWIQDLLKKDKKQQAGGISEGGGRLVYIIGGDVEESITSKLVADIPIDDLLGCEGVSDKRTLILHASDVIKVAKESGEKKQTKGALKKNTTRGKMTAGDRKNTPKGAWTKKDNSVKKQRGYENFKRFGTD